MSCPDREPRGQVVSGGRAVAGLMEEQRMASEQEILSGLAEIVNEETGLPTDSVLADKSFTDDLDIDSLSMMTIVVNAEEKFSVRIPDEDVKNLRTVGDAVAYISQAQG
jgi:acyl carrier protein